MNIKRLNWLKSGMAVGLVLSGVNISGAFQIGALDFNVLTEDPPQVSASAYKNTDITEVIIPDTVINEGVKYAVTRVGGFSNCPNLTTLYLPHTVSEIQNPTPYDFMGDKSSNFADIEVAADNPWFSSVDGILYNKDITELIFCPYGRKEVNVPEGVVTVKGSAFSRRPQLESVILPESLSSIEEYAFNGCVALSAIIFPSRLKYIGENAFSFCSGLKMDLVLHSGIEYVGEYAFYCCSSLESLTYFANSPTLPLLCFSNCTSLKWVKIGPQVNYIDYYAFSGCDRLETVELSESVTDFPGSAFSYCHSLRNFIISEANPVLMSENGIVYNKEKSKLYCGPGVVGALTVPEGIVEIEKGAFMDNTMLTEITFPSSLVDIDSNAFYNCRNVKKITCFAQTPPDVGSFALDYDDLKNGSRLPANVYVPANALEAYRENADWRGFGDRLQAISEAGIEDVNSAEETFYEVFSLDGRQVLKAASRDELQGLERGIYIVNGKKMAL